MVASFIPSVLDELDDVVITSPQVKHVLRHDGTEWKNAQLAHSDLSGLSNDEHSIYALLAGRSGGQTLIGGTAASENLTLQSTSHATKGKILFGTSGYDEVNNRLLLGTSSGNNLLTVAGAASIGSAYASTSAPANGLIVEGDVGIGTSAIVSGAKVAIAADGEGCYMYCTTHRTTTGGGGFVFRTSKGTQASPVAITSGSDYYGKFSFEGYDGSTYRPGASIEARVDGTPGSNDMPGRLMFYTTPDGTGAVVERMRITNAGNVLVNTTSFGSSAAGVFGIGNGTAPTSSPADMIQIFSTDISGGDATLGLRTEASVAADTDETKFSNKLPVKINGATYYIMLTTT